MVTAAARGWAAPETALFRRHRVAAVALVVLIVAGGALRADRAIEAAADPGRRVSADERAYSRIAVDLVRHGTYGDAGMGNPVYWAPGTPFAFALTDVVAPATDVYHLPGAPILQLALGLGLLTVAWQLGRRLAGPAAGLTAAALLAIYPPLVYVTGTQLSEPMAALLLLAAVLAVQTAWQRNRAAAWGVAGLLLGMAVLVRADLLLAPAVAALVAGWFAWRAAGRAAALRPVALILAGAAVAILPWVTWASWHERKPVPVSDGGAQNLFVGTFLPGGGTIFGFKRELGPQARRLYPSLRGRTNYQLKQYQVLRVVAHRRPDEPVGRAIREEALANLGRYAAGRPLDFAGMMAAKAHRMWLMYFVGGGRDRTAAVSVLHIVLVLLALAGLAGGIAVSRHPILVLLAALLAYSTAVNLMLVAEPRHNLPLLPLLVTGGVAGGAMVIERVRARERSGSPTPALGHG
jgi:4-amino-4-deoxy-L-arabinose transferase-like glycosyltransferase